jgi:hypothetical protein
LLWLALSATFVASTGTSTNEDLRAQIAQLEEQLSKQRAMMNTYDERAKRASLEHDDDDADSDAVDPHRFLPRVSTTSFKNTTSGGVVALASLSISLPHRANADAAMPSSRLPSAGAANRADVVGVVTAGRWLLTFILLIGKTTTTFRSIVCN